MNKRHLATFALCLIAVSTLALLGVGEVLSRPATRSIGSPPTDFAADTVRIPLAGEQFVVGWFARGSVGSGAVLLLHGVRADRTQMLARARSLSRLGYSVLLIDLPAHGESTGERITFGAREAAGAAKALDFLRSQTPGERLAVIGVSLGAASTVLAQFSTPPEAVVLESMYPTIEEAIADRLRMTLGPLGASLTPLLLWQLPLRTGVSPNDLEPIQHIQNLRAPVLIASGTKDRHTTWAETERLFEAASEPKELWRVEGAEHVDLYQYNPEEYERRVFHFLAKYLRNGA